MSIQTTPSRIQWLEQEIGKIEKNTMLRLAAVIKTRAKECGKSSEKNSEPYAAAFVVVGIVLDDLAETIKKEAKTL